MARIGPDDPRKPLSMEDMTFVVRDCSSGKPVCYIDGKTTECPKQINSCGWVEEYQKPVYLISLGIFIVVVLVVVGLRRRKKSEQRI